MLSKKEAKDIQSLALKKHRDEMRCFMAEGPKMVSELARLVPGQIKKIYATREWLAENNRLPQTNVVEVSEQELERVSSLRTPHQVVAVLKQFDSIRPDASGFVLYLDTIQDPGNMGTIIRIGDWFGVRHIVCSAGCADLYNPKVVQASMASIARVNVYIDEAGSWLDDQASETFAAVLDGKPVYEYERIEKGILMIGNESKGLGDNLLLKAKHKITIPKKGGAESLNAAVATGILLSHLLK